MEGTVLEEFSPAECNHGWLAVGRLHHPVADGLRVLVPDRFRARMVDRQRVYTCGGQACWLGWYWLAIE